MMTKSNLLAIKHRKQLCPEAWEQLMDLIDSPAAPTDALKQLISRARHSA